MSDPITQSMMQGAAGASGEDPQWVDEVFDIQTYKGTGTTHKMTSSVDNTKGGMLMWAPRSGLGGDRYLYDTVRGVNMSLYPTGTSAGDNRSGSPDVASFDNNGFTLTGNNINNTVYNAVIWNWRKAPGFFDCFEYTGTGADNNIINHKLKALPGLIIVKRTDAAGDWVTVCGPWTGGTEYTFGSNATQFAWNNNNVTYSVSAFANIATANTVNVSRLQWHEGNGAFQVNGGDHNASGATYMCYMWAMGAEDGTTDAAIYGENKDQAIISCGIYSGDGGSDHLINLGWEPQFVMYKRVFNGGDDWQIYDAQRGVVSRYGDQRITVNSTGQEDSQPDRIDFEGMGWRIKTNNGEVNDGSGRYFYMAIRRSEGIVGKPAEVGTDVFNIDTGNNSSVIPCFDAAFPVDFGLVKRYTSTDEWWLGTRLTQGYYLETSRNEAEAAWGGVMMFDSNKGWFKHSGYGTETISYMWKRHAGLDVVNYRGNGSNRQIKHSLGKVPEMMWLKNKSNTGKWNIYHKGAGGGVNPEQWYILFVGGNPGTYGPIWNNTAPTATHFTVGSYGEVNSNNDGFNMILFASVPGISKVGYYAGSDSEQTITTGFSPRFLTVRNISTTENWGVWDTVRGWSSGNDKNLKFDDNAAQTEYNFGAGPTSTGFTFNGNNTAMNKAGQTFIYYAHA